MRKGVKKCLSFQRILGCSGCLLINILKMFNIRRICPNFVFVSFSIHNNTILSEVIVFSVFSVFLLFLFFCYFCFSVISAFLKVFS
jgi:hypothetical protein